MLSLHKDCKYVYSYNLQPDYEKSLRIIESSEIEKSSEDKMT